MGGILPPLMAVVLDELLTKEVRAMAEEMAANARLAVQPNRWGSWVS